MTFLLNPEDRTNFMSLSGKLPIKFVLTSIAICLKTAIRKSSIRSHKISVSSEKRASSGNYQIHKGTLP